MTNREVPLHIETLKAEFEEKIQRNRNYSLRAFARDLKMSAASLSGLLKQTKGISKERASRVAHQIGLTGDDLDLFVLSATSLHARKTSARNVATEELKHRLRSKTRTRKIGSNDFEDIQSWYHLALLEVTELEDCAHAPDWFAAKLGLSLNLVKLALERLIRSGLLKFENGRYQASSTESTTDVDRPSMALKNYHSSLLKKADESLFSTPVEAREFNNMTLAFSLEELDEAKQFIREFQREFAKKFYRETAKKNSVYQLSIQFFRLDEARKDL